MHTYTLLILGMYVSLHYTMFALYAACMHRPILSALQTMHTVPFESELVHSESYRLRPDADADVDSDVDSATEDTTRTATAAAAATVPSYLPATVTLPAVASRSGKERLEFTCNNVELAVEQLKNSTLDRSQVQYFTVHRFHTLRHHCQFASVLLSNI
jgi:hypothetical protein